MQANEIHKFVESSQRLVELVASLTPEQLLWAPPQEAGIGLWSIQQVVLHVVDTDLIWANRIKQIIADDNPRILAFDENKYMAKLSYERQSAATAAMTLDLNRRNFSQVLSTLPASAWNRTGQHEERGEMRLSECVELMQWHLEHHAEFIRQKRAHLGL